MPFESTTLQTSAESAYCSFWYLLHFPASPPTTTWTPSSTGGPAPTPRPTSPRCSPTRTRTGSTSTAPPSSTWPPAASGPKPGSWRTSSCSRCYARRRALRPAGAQRAPPVRRVHDPGRLPPPRQLIARGPWTLWDDQESVGTVPQVAGTRKCSLWAKGDVGDWWLKQVFGGRPFRQIMGFNADEEGRRFGDQVTSRMPWRTGEFPLIDWGWTGSAARTTCLSGSACTGRSRTARSAASPPPWARFPPTWSACAPTRTSPARCCAWSTRR